MAGQYHLDTGQYSLDKFRRLIESQELSPGRRILKEKLQERFSVLESLGISNLGMLIDRLKTADRLKKFAAESGLPVDYLTVLSRHARSLTPMPLSLKDIPGVDPAYVNGLAALGVKNAKQLFERSVTPADRAALSSQANVPGKVLLELVRMSDIARVGYVGPIFARLMYEAGVDSLKTLAANQPEDLYARLVAVNSRLKLTKGSFTVRDVAYCVEAAKEHTQIIEY
ncbi:DUF4332 domain-containing protein [Methanocella arvoryzae]|nr:DUF4332 domain-containing protein [Methanocella arvoryzae]